MRLPQLTHELPALSVLSVEISAASRSVPQTLRFDEDLAREVRQKRCPDCGGALHPAPCPRKPRSTAATLSREFCVRFSFCCAVEGCRHRATPPSLRFLGPKVYWAAVVVLTCAMRCGATPRRMESLKELEGVSRQTVLRWQVWSQQVLPQSPFWRAACGAFRSTVQICELPQSLLEQFAGSVDAYLRLVCRSLPRHGQADLAAEGGEARIVRVAQDEGVEEEVRDAHIAVG
ncbi:MAG: hypothetical protein JWO52_7143 [Gammaproteobacteria bacterium]|nr:hypothetical protein [Gammaproteobacteria bacterium]